MAKWIIGIVVVVLIGAALWWSGWLKSGMTSPATTTTNTAPTDQTQTQPTPQEQQAAIQQQNGMSAQSDDSDAALQQDAASVDTQMQGLNSDSSSVNSSLSDQPVQQSY